VDDGVEDEDIAYTPQDDTDNPYDTFGQFSEVFLTLGYDMFYVTAAEVVAALPSDRTSYYSVGASVDRFNVSVGKVDVPKNRFVDGSITTPDDVINAFDSAANDYVHVDLTFAYNDNFSLTLSQIVDQDDVKIDTEERDDLRDDDLNVVLAYSVEF
jgi:hypothetical protein